MEFISLFKVTYTQVEVFEPGVSLLLNVSGPVATRSEESRKALQGEAKRPLIDRASAFDSHRMEIKANKDSTGDVKNKAEDSDWPLYGEQGTACVKVVLPEPGIQTCFLPSHFRISFYGPTIHHPRGRRSQF